MGMIIDVFARYAGAEGSQQSLTKGELKVLTEKELPGFLQVGAQGRGAVGWRRRRGYPAGLAGGRLPFQEWTSCPRG